MYADTQWYVIVIHSGTQIHIDTWYTELCASRALWPPFPYILVYINYIFFVSLLNPEDNKLARNSPPCLWHWQDESSTPTPPPHTHTHYTCRRLAINGPLKAPPPVCQPGVDIRRQLNISDIYIYTYTQRAFQGDVKYLDDIGNTVKFSRQVGCKVRLVYNYLYKLVGHIYKNNTLHKNNWICTQHTFLEVFA